MSAARKIRVLVVDDSAAYREMLRHLLEDCDDIEVAGEAGDAASAVARTLAIRPDVITMDLVMPGGGVAATRAVMQALSTPILVITAPVVQSQSTLPFEAIEAGAVEVFLKPARLTGQEGREQAAELRERVRSLAARRAPAIPAATASRTATARPAECKVVVLAASTGGPAAVLEVLRALTGSLRAAILVVQHIGREFEAGLIEWWAGHSPRPVRFGLDGDRLIPGSVLVAPAGRHLKLAGKATISIAGGPPVNGCRPSADVTMESAAEKLGASCAGVVLTGMGSDGARGLLAIRKAGGWTAAQDEQTSVIYGMPREAARLGAAACVLPLPQIGPRLLDMIGGAD